MVNKKLLESLKSNFTLELIRAISTGDSLFLLDSLRYTGFFKMENPMEQSRQRRDSQY